VLFLVVLAGFFAPLNTYQFEDVFARWPPTSGPTPGSRLATWDSAHYLILSQNGYSEGSTSCAFYPLWPAVIRAAAWPGVSGPLVMSLLLANLASVGAFCLLFRLVENQFGTRIARDTVILMLAFPSALFFSFGYTESIFLLLLIGFFYGLDMRQYRWSAIAGFLLPLTRPVGVFMVLPLAWHLFQNHLPGALRRWLAAQGFRSTRSEGQDDPQADSPFAWLLLLCPVLGYAAYFGLMYLSTGNAFEGFAAQHAYPYSPSIRNMFDFKAIAYAAFRVGSLDGMLDSALDRWAFIFVVGLLPLVYRKNKTWFWYVLPAGVVPALTSCFMSYRRYTIVLFPIFVVLAQLLAKGKGRLVFWYYVIIFAALQAWAILQFMTFNWAG
jgi:hypothetical protein